MTTILKAKQNVIKNNPEYKNLINAVVRRVGLDSVLDIVNNGVSGGFSGFIYYADTVSFWRKYRNEITLQMKNLASDLGEDMGSFLSGFRCFEGFELDELLEAFYGRYNDEYTNIYNGFAWYAAEEVCRMISDEIENN